MMGIKPIVSPTGGWGAPSAPRPYEYRDDYGRLHTTGVSWLNSFLGNPSTAKYRKGSYFIIS
jgi:hypothetical protein